MSLRRIVDVAEIVSAVAVVVSLIYLAGQIRQNTESVQAAMAQSFVDASINLMQPLVENKESMRVVYLGAWKPEELDDVEGAQFRMYATGMLRNWEIQYFGHSRGTLEPALFESFTRFVRSAVRPPGFAIEWERRRGLYDPGFEAFIDGLVAEKELGDGEVSRKPAGTP